MAWSICSYECVSSVQEATGMDAHTCWGVAKCHAFTVI